MIPPVETNTLFELRCVANTVPYDEMMIRKENGKNEVCVCGVVRETSSEAIQKKEYIIFE